MATFAEYQSHPMASNNDFQLYPYPDMWNQDQSFLPTSTYEDQNYPTSTSYDSYQSQQPYAQPDQFTFGTEQSFLPKHNLQPPSPNYSPTYSASHSFSFDLQPPILSSTSDSGASIQSAISSAIGSPSAQAQASKDWSQQQSMSMLPGIVQQDSMDPDVFATTGFDLDTIPSTDKGCVDPALIQPTSYSPTQYIGTQFPDMSAHSPRNMVFNQAPSPAPSQTAVQSPRPPMGKVPGSTSPYMRTQSYQPYPVFNGSRRQSISSAHSPHSQVSLSSEDSNKGLCPLAACGRHVKDLKAHMLTHQNERPEKCPIPTCEYHTKGFARKYDKNRHTLTHYKGTMVCGFCPGSGSAAEKSFNRADVFKRHLTSVHGVEQTPPNARRKSPSAAGAKKGFGGRDVSGMCSTCGVTFASAQEFYEHLDDCVLRVVQQADPSEAINEKLLASVAEDQQVQETMEKHMLPTDVDFTASTSFINDNDEEVEEDDEDAEDDTNDTTYGTRAAKSGKGTLRTSKKSSTSTSS